MLIYIYIYSITEHSSQQTGLKISLRLPNVAYGAKTYIFTIFLFPAIFAASCNYNILADLSSYP